jgi:hypothetical protein
LRVVSSTPEPLSVVAPFDNAVRIRFERDLSERLASGGGSIQDAVIVSPMTGEPRIETGGSGIEVSIEGGFLPGIVYRVTVLPRFQDRFQNRMAVPFDLIFSTGPDLSPNLIAGIVTSRLTLQSLAGIRIEANMVEGEYPYTAVTDSTGFFTFPHIPEGRYTLVAFEDQNRNRRPDFSERQESIALAINDGDTLIVNDLALLAPDTTAAVLESVALQDSTGLLLTFDDHIDPAASLDEVEATLTREGANAPEITEILHPAVWRAQNASDDAPLAGPPLPSQEILLILSRPLLEGVTYRLEVSGVPNIRGVPGGGGEAEVEGRPVRPEAPAPAEGAPALPLDPPI